jgi:hypothetical protein
LASIAIFAICYIRKNIISQKYGDNSITKWIGSHSHPLTHKSELDHFSMADIRVTRWFFSHLKTWGTHNGNPPNLLIYKPKTGSCPPKCGKYAWKTKCWMSSTTHPMGERRKNRKAHHHMGLDRKISRQLRFLG